MSIDWDKRRFRILLIDDDESDRLFARRSLLSIRDHVEISEVDDGSKALLELGRNEFDIILLDLRMPGLDGFEVLSRLKTMVPKTPTIVFSTSSDRGDRDRALTLGASAYVRKPHSTADYRIFAEGLFAFWHDVVLIGDE